MGAHIYKARAWRNDDSSISVRFTYVDNGSPQATATWTAKVGATVQDVVDTFASDTDEGLQRVIAALEEI